MATKCTLLLLLLLPLLCVVASPARSRSPTPTSITYDQRQAGDLNVRADLENFVILVIPTTSAAGSGLATMGLLDLLAKAIPLRNRNKRIKHPKEHHNQNKKQEREEEEEKDEEHDDMTMAFIESKTAPYHVDISKSRKNLAMLHPTTPAAAAAPTAHGEELLVSPNLALIKSDDNDVRIAKGFVLTVPVAVA